MCQVMHFSLDDGQLVVRGLVVDARSCLECQTVPIFSSALNRADGPYLSTSSAPERSDAPHCRSCKALTGYHIHAVDGDAGHVQKLLVDESTSAVRAIVVDTSNWWMGHSVLIDPQWVIDVGAMDRILSVNLTREAVKNSPPYELARWRVAATRTGNEGGPPIEDEVQRATRPSAEEAAKILIHKSSLQGESLPAGRPHETDVERLLHFGFEITTISLAV